MSAALALAAAPLAAPPAIAASGPSVEVDLSALDALGPPRPASDGERIELRPPKALRAAPADAGAPGAAADAGSAEPAAGAPPASAGPGSGEGAAAPETQAASAPPAVEVGKVRLVFAAGSAELPEDAEAKLEPLAERLKEDESLRVQVLAFASGEGAAERQAARRLALSRALAVRLYLTENGVGGTRTLVRALGTETDEKPLDRVDLVVVK